MSPTVPCDREACSDTTTWESLFSETSRCPAWQATLVTAVTVIWLRPKRGCFCPCACIGWSEFNCAYVLTSPASPVALWQFCYRATFLCTLPKTIRQSSRQTWGCRSTGLRLEDLSMNQSSPSLTSYEHWASSFFWASAYSPVKWDKNLPHRNLLKLNGEIYMKMPFTAFAPKRYVLVFF